METFEQFIEKKAAHVGKKGGITYPKGTPNLRWLPKTHKEWEQIEDLANKTVKAFERLDMF
jgi:hypothetical protein